MRNATEDTGLREHLIATAAQLIGRPSATTPTVRDIAREAGVAGGVLYNYFSDKDELLAEALIAHVHDVMSTVAELPRPGTATVEANLREFIERGLTVLRQVVPAFSRFFSQPAVMAHVRGQFSLGAHEGLPSRLAEYLRGEQGLGRIDPRADPVAVATLVIGACHELTLPRALLDPSAAPPEVPPTFVDGLVRTVLHGIAPPTP